MTVSSKGAENRDSARWASVCPKCEPDNPAARYLDTCLRHRVEENLPAHYIGCDRFETYNYGTRMGTCDCTATADFEALLTLLRNDGVGRCGDLCPQMSGAPAVFCRLRHGHTGWHKADDGSEWNISAPESTS